MRIVTCIISFLLLKNKFNQLHHKDSEFSVPLDDRLFRLKKYCYAMYWKSVGTRSCTCTYDCKRKIS